METAYEAQCRHEDAFHVAFDTVWRAARRPSYTAVMELLVDACGTAEVEVAEENRPLFEFMREQINARVPLNWFAIKANEFSFDEAVRQGKVARAALLELLELPPEEPTVVAS